MAGCSPLNTWLRWTSRAEEGASEVLGRMAKVSARNPWKCLANKDDDLSPQRTSQILYFILFHMFSETRHVR